MDLATALDAVLTDAYDAAEAGAPVPAPIPAGADLGARDLIGRLRALVPTRTDGRSVVDWARSIGDIAGIDRRTVQRIAAGTSQGSKSALAKLRGAWDDQRRRLEADRRKEVRAARAQARKDLTARLARPRGPLIIEAADVTVSGDSRPRRVDVGSNGIPTSARERVIHSWQAGNADGAAGQLLTAIQGHYTPGITFENIKELTWE